MPPPEELDVAEALPRALKIFGTVVAPSTLLTALLFYFGRLHITGMFRYLGVNFTVLDFSFQDYLVRSVDGLFVPLAVVAGSALLLLWSHGVLVRTLPRARRRVLAGLMAPVLLVAGVGMVAIAVAGVSGWPALADVPEVPGLCLAIGVLLLAAGARILRRGHPEPTSLVVAEWGSVFVVLAIGLFWAVGNYAIGVGTTRGQQIERDLATSPDVTLFSDKDLGLTVPGVGAATCGDPADPSGYRYTGLKLVLQSGGQYLFLPVGWTRSRGAALVVPRSDELRLEFARPATATAPSASGGSC